MTTAMMIARASKMEMDIRYKPREVIRCLILALRIDIRLPGIIFTCQYGFSGKFLKIGARKLLT
jgi:hypothetical protein